MVCDLPYCTQSTSHVLQYRVEAVYWQLCELPYTEILNGLLSALLYTVNFPYIAVQGGGRILAAAQVALYRDIEWPVTCPDIKVWN